MLIGRHAVADMVALVELEAAKAMWTQTGKPPMWMEHPAGKGDLFRVEVNPVTTKFTT